MTGELELGEKTSKTKFGKKLSRFLEAFWKWFEEYSKKTSIHGLKYVVDRNRSLAEKTFWVIILAASICVCSKMIHDLWTKWNESPVVVAFNNVETSVRSIPFPAITICPEQQFNLSVVDLKLLLRKCSEKRTLNFEDSRYIALASQVCSNFFILADDLCKHLYKQNREINIVADLNRTKFDFVVRFSNRCENKELTAVPVVTTEGLCYTFNRLQLGNVYRDHWYTFGFHSVLDFMNYHQYKGKTSWNRDDGYSNEANIKTYPKKILGTGRKLGIEVVVSANSYLYSNDICLNKSPGFKLALHAPDNVPSFDERFFSIPINKSILAAVSIKLLRTSKSLRSLSPDKRRCYFSNEHNLKFFKIYTKSNCELECLTNFTLEQCKCVKFSMPRFNGTKVCQSFEKVKCYKEADDKYFEKRSEYAKTYCDCLPPCNSVVYRSEVSQVNLPVNFKIPAKYEAENSKKVILTHVTIYFKEENILTAKRSELYGLTQFASNCGGLLGLFLGVSALSFVEIFYFSIVRVFSNFCNKSFN